MFSSPFISFTFPGLSLVGYRLLAIVLYSISFTKVDLPLHDTPVTQVNIPSGKFTFIFFRLFSLAPMTLRFLFIPFLLVFGVSIHSLPLKYLPVRLFSSFATSFGVPLDTRYPPLSPATGPMSTR